MPVGRDSSVIQEVQKTAYRFVFLYEIGSAHGTEYYVVSNAPVTVQGQTYQPMEIKFQDIKRQGGTQIGRVVLTIDNTELDFSQALQAGDYDGHRVSIYLHFPDLPDSKEIFFQGFIEGYIITVKEVKVELVPSTDYMSFQVPCRRFSTKCLWVFKSEECGYTGPETSCPKTYDGCLNKARFGGFPFIEVI